MIKERWLARSRMADVGIFRTTVGIESVSERGRIEYLADTLVDTGSEFTWIPRAILEALGVKPERRQGFIVADGRQIERDIGFAIVHVGGVATADDVVFAEDNDLVLLGVRSLEGLNLRVDVVGKRLVEAGPILAACGSRAPIAPREHTATRRRAVTHS
jgi:predicted aspartyl protease